MFDKLEAIGFLGAGKQVAPFKIKTRIPTGTGTPALTQDLVILLRSLPKCATGKEIETFLRKGYAVAHRGPPRVFSRDTRRSLKTLQSLIDQPWDKSTKKFCPGSPQRDGATNIITKTIGSASGDIGIVYKKQEITKEFFKEVVPDVPNMWKQAKPFVYVGIGLLALGTLADLFSASRR